MPAFGQSTDNSISMEQAERGMRTHAEQVPEPARFAAIVFCPCCVTAQDVEAARGVMMALECVACGQQWQMVVSEERQAAHSVN